MSSLVVVGFKGDRSRAAGALGKLRKLDFGWTGKLDDAVAVYRDHRGKLVVDQSRELTAGEGAVRGAVWGGLIGLVSAIFTGGATLPAAAALAAAASAVGATIGGVGAKWWKAEFGISDHFICLVGEMLQPEDSAIFAVLEGAPANFQYVFEGFGGKVLITSLSDEQKDKIENVLNEAGRK